MSPANSNQSSSILFVIIQSDLFFSNPRCSPVENWYKGEIGFFDFYIIPLAKKLKDCGIFGVSSDEYLNYAIKNRQEWEDKGEAVVAEMVEALKKEWKEEEEAQALKEDFVESHEGR